MSEVNLEHFHDLRLLHTGLLLFLTFLKIVIALVDLERSLEQF